MSVVYTDNDPFVCEWLRELVGRGHLGLGRVVEHDIRDLGEAAPTLHAFCGIGGWPLALDYAGWPRDAPVWTGSCPCQPFSTAGRRKGTDDERHLWPAWRDLIEEHRPPVIFGEQVASPDGRSWLAAVQTDLEALGYSFGAADLCAAGVGAPHLRQRLYFVAIADGERREGIRLHLRQRGSLASMPEATRRSQAGLVGDAAGGAGDGGICRESEDHIRRQSEGSSGKSAPEAGSPGALDDSDDKGSQRRPRRAAEEGEITSPSNWADVEWLPCRDGKWRPTQPGLQPLADGVPGRVGKLCAYGNAIVPQVAAIFIRASMESICA